MKIKFWGCRGSIPVPDRRMIRYGGNTTCIEVTIDNKTLIIDAGTGIRMLGEDLINRKISDMDIFITHSHWDHIQGFPFFMPIYSGKTNINIFGCTNSYRQLKSIFAKQMSIEYFPVRFSELKSNINFVEACGSEYTISNHKIKTIRTNHPIFTVGLRIEKNDKSFVFITDNEIMDEKPQTSRTEFVNFCKDATYLVHDTQFKEEEYATRKGWGHSTFKQAVDLARYSDVKNLGFFHHDPDRKDSELDIIEKQFKDYCRDKGYKFSVFAVKEMDEINL
ncbi:MAG: MBL fold metallo-hydrolase [Elusimicrobia bacterium]|nr:MBL fold metallo-hydrolase [Elusimicrobiota bacterium]